MIDHARFAHFDIKIVAFARPFAHTTEDGKSAMPFGNVVDQLEDDDCLANAGATECAHFAAFGKGADQVDHLNSSLKNLRFDVLIRERRRGPMNRIPFCELNRAFVIDRIAGNIENASESSVAYWHGDGATGVAYFHPAL